MTLTINVRAQVFTRDATRCDAFNFLRLLERHLSMTIPNVVDEFPSDSEHFGSLFAPSGNIDKVCKFVYFHDSILHYVI